MCEPSPRFCTIFPGHQKKIMLAIERLKRIQSTSRRLSAMDHKPSAGSHSPALEPPSAYPTPQWLIGASCRPATHFTVRSEAAQINIEYNCVQISFPTKQTFKVVKHRHGLSLLCFFQTSRAADRSTSIIRSWAPPPPRHDRPRALQTAVAVPCAALRPARPARTARRRRSPSTRGRSAARRERT